MMIARWVFLGLSSFALSWRAASSFVVPTIRKTTTATTVAHDRPGRALFRAPLGGAVNGLRRDDGVATTTTTTVSARRTIDDGNVRRRRTPSACVAAALVAASVAYWYLLVFGAAAAANGLPVPSFVPLVPGWPPSDHDLVPVLEDSAHFFYLSDVLRTATTPPPSSTLRVAFFNVAEAWVFSFLPLLLADEKRPSPAPVAWATWLGALGLTNAFLAPYLALRELLLLNGDHKQQQQEKDEEVETATTNEIGPKALRVVVGATAVAVVGYATIQVARAEPGEWSELSRLIRTDRTYAAFAVDLVLFACFQSFLLSELDAQNNGGNDDNARLNNVPFVGLVAWLFRN